MKKIRLIASAATIAAALAFTGCPEDKPAEDPKPAEPAPEEKPTIPDYAPTGDHADIKKAAAAGITGDNAMDKAKALGEELDKAIKDLEAPAEGAEGGEEKPAEK
jgi:hypothetical protein